MKTGTVVISLDFELMWGVFDSAGKSYEKKIDTTAYNVDRLLDQLDEYDIKTTWGCVGALACVDVDQLNPELLSKRIQVANQPLLSFVELLNKFPHRYFAPKVIDRLATSHHEIISHTMFHRVWTDGSKNEFELELNEASRLLPNISPGLIFCRNVTNQKALMSISKSGVRFYRSAPGAWFEGFKRLSRYLGLIDSYIPLWSGTVRLARPIEGARLRPVPHTLFMRVSTKNTFLKKIHLLRLILALNVAAYFGRCVHFWVHPHNFALDNGDYDLSFLIKILKRIRILEDKGLVEVKTMGEI